MNKLILLATPIILAVILMGCAKTQTIECSSPYIKSGTGCCLDQNSNQICDSDETAVPAETQTTTPAPQPEPQEPEQPEYVTLTLNRATENLGYLPKAVTITNLTAGDYVKFKDAGVEVTAIYGNAIVTSVHGASIGQKFTVAKNAPVDVYTKDGKIRMDFRDNNILFIEKIVD